MKAFLSTYNRIIYQLAQNMIAAGGRADNVNHCTKFIGIVATMDWSATRYLHGDRCTALTRRRHTSSLPATRHLVTYKAPRMTWQFIRRALRATWSWNSELQYQIWKEFRDLAVI